jgi:hypothetical protein
MIDDEVLIQLVSKYEELYNPKHNHYSNQKIRDYIWDEIGEMMEETGKFYNGFIIFTWFCIQKLFSVTSRGAACLAPSPLHTRSWLS